MIELQNEQSLKGPSEEISCQACFQCSNSLIHHLVPYLYLFIHKQRIFIRFFKGPIFTAVVKVLQMSFPDLRCLQIFLLPFHLSIDKRYLKKMYFSSDWWPTLVFRKTPVLYHWGRCFNTALSFSISFHFRAAPELTCP